MSLINSVQASIVLVNSKQDLQQQLDLAKPGDHLILGPGRYQGNFVINKTLELSGKKGAILDGH